MSTDERKPVPSANRILKDLQKRPEVIEYLAQYETSAADRFIRAYAAQVHSVLKTVPILSERKENLPFQFIDLAEKLFWEIQQKKLFNLQCQWRAEEITIPGVESCIDFDYWEDYIESCPFLPQVTPEEYNLYLRYLTTGNPTEEVLDGYQDYERWKEDVKEGWEGSTYPHWYEYYDTVMGTGSLLKLPDIRGEKEDFYLQIGFRNERVQQEWKRKFETDEPKEFDRRPMLHPFMADMKKFAENFDHPDVLKYMNVLWSDTEDEPEVEEGEVHMGDVWAAVDYLTDQEEVISLVKHKDWREQLLRTAERHKWKQVADAMPSVYAGYRMRMETGLGYPLQEKMWPYGPGGSMVEIHSLATEQKQIILRGRELNGEPPDWNF